MMHLCFAAWRIRQESSGGDCRVTATSIRRYQRG